ncbi:conserved hypothetical protein TIGR00726 [Luminiphilus syltensis NOR5-1B]|uniref:Purine nucleoside phosphorylase n=1 Tax=Luminiphilus syltensis NOR5-1B TaxID=565045 RepID=B8KX22_9GAMM|nr:conserved hypothetical protein TIGR00726 [Luminiphilus syltensis NOR5-1B]
MIALQTERRGGVSTAPFDSFNTAHHVGDDPGRVARNRQILTAALPHESRVVWLDQVHGSNVVSAHHVKEGSVEADASWTDVPGVFCAVMTADCLPLLLADRDGRCVAAVHCGWRGLVAGVVDSTVRQLPVLPDRLQAWLGPAIGPQAFEVGPEVREAFDAALGARANHSFRPAQRAGHAFADIYSLATDFLHRAGVTSVSGGGCCTVTQADRFFSYRRDGVTGRTATLIGIDPGSG